MDLDERRDLAERMADRLAERVLRHYGEGIPERVIADAEALIMGWKLTETVEDADAPCPCGCSTNMA